MKKIDVLIVYEHVSRELESALLLKKKLIEAGLTAEIALTYWTEPLARALYSPKLVIVPWCYDDSDYHSWKNYNGGFENHTFKILNLHCEQIGNSEDVGYMLPTGKAKDVYHCSWGENFKKLLMSSGVKAKDIFVTGSPRLDFYRSEFRQVSIGKKALADKYKLNANKKWALIIGSFSGDILKGNSLRHLEERGYKNTAVMIEIVLSSYSGILNWLTGACKDDGIADEFEIIYRPHPSEWVTPEITKIQEKYPNFHIISEFPIRDWMINSDVLYAWNSTSAVEAIFADRPIYFLRPVEMPETFKSESLELVEQITSSKRFVESFTTYSEEEKLINREFKEDIKNYYDISEKTTVERTVEAVHAILNDERNKIQCKVTISYKIKKMVSFGIKYVLYKIGLLKNVSGYSVICEDILSKEEFEEYESRINRSEDIYES